MTDEYICDLKRYNNFAVGLARDSGLLLNRRLGRIRRIAYKGRINLTTDVDLRCEEMIVGRIKRAFPDHGILTEERGEVSRGRSGFIWLIDPIDGTTNYAHGFPFFSVSIALLIYKRPVTGVVYDPLRNELFSSVDGGGAFLNKRRIRVSNISSLEKSLLATGFPYKFGRDMRRNLENFKRFMLLSQAVRRPGSAALDLCYVAAGRLDGFWECELHPWDTAAASLIVREADGKVTTYNGGEFDPFKKDIVASNLRIHSQMLKVLR